MDFLPWKDEIKLNIKIIDEQHYNMVAMMNSMHRELNRRNIAEEIDTVKKLIKDLIAHFETEERLMKDNSFPGYISHKLEHDRYLKKVENFAHDMKDGKAKINMILLNSLRNWFLQHIELNDRKLTEFLISKKLS